MASSTVADTDVKKKGEGFVMASDPEVRLLSRAVKMSKSRGNVVNPDDVISKVGADSLRLYLMFMGPLEQVKPWSITGVDGVYRFLNRVWRLLVDGAVPMTEEEPSAEQMSVLHKTIKRVTEDTEVPPPVYSVIWKTLRYGFATASLAVSALAISMLCLRRWT